MDRLISNQLPAREQTGKSVQGTLARITLVMEAIQATMAAGKLNSCGDITAEFKIFGDVDPLEVGELYGALLQSLELKHSELRKTLLTSLKMEHPMVAMATKVASHLRHGWVRFEGNNLYEVEVAQQAYEGEGSENDAGIRPPVSYRVRMAYGPGSFEVADLCMVGSSQTGRYGWEVTKEGDLNCDICRPDGVAIAIKVKRDGKTTVTKGDQPFEDKHIKCAYDLLAACSPCDQREVITDSLLTQVEYAAWQQRVEEGDSGRTHDVGFGGGGHAKTE
jgi:hypothetical protein